MATSYNGWAATSTGTGIDRAFTAGGVAFPGGVLSGAVSTVFRWLVERLATIETPVAGWNWGWEYRANVNNPATLSCHASGTAIDWRAPTHPNGGSRYGGWNDSQVNAIRGWLAELDGVVRWGADFSGTKDPMHFEIVGSAAQVAEVAARLGGSPGKPTPTPGGDLVSEIEEFLATMDEQQFKQLVHDGMMWMLEDKASGVNPIIIEEACARAANAAAERVVAQINEQVKIQLAKLLPAGIQADVAQLQAAKEIVHDATKWALEDPNVDVSRFRG